MNRSMAPGGTGTFDCAPALIIPSILGGLQSGVSCQCHTNHDEWRQTLTKDRKEKVNLTSPI